MLRYSEAVKADVIRLMSPPQRQSVAQISAELGIHVVTLYNWRKAWRLQGEVVPASEKDPDGWGATDKFTVVLETAGLNATQGCLKVDSGAVFRDLNTAQREHPFDVVRQRAQTSTN